MSEQILRKKVIDTCLSMNASGLNQGTSGNVSVRFEDGFLITPSSMPYDHMRPKDIMFMKMDGSAKGLHNPSSEWRFHRDILNTRPDINAVVHTHAAHCTTLALLGKSIPAVHYMVAVAGGADIRCCPYATFGTQDLSDYVLEALKNRFACLMTQHGMIACGASLDKALWLATEVETLARQYWGALQIGTPEILSDAEIERVLEKMKSYKYGREE
ncbi:MAG: class II aldolase [Robiginitomaculum sp.]|nr:MAG: class II aldolase [Robiginitomaculum sp.]